MQLGSFRSSTLEGRQPYTMEEREKKIESRDLGRRSPPVFGSNEMKARVPFGSPMLAHESSADEQQRRWSRGDESKPLLAGAGHEGSWQRGQKRL